MFELLVSLGIAFILLMLIIPSQRNNINKAVVEVVKLQLLQAVHLAQSEAIARGEIVTLCQSADQSTCSGRWKHDYIILSGGKVVYSFMNPKNEGELYFRAFPVHQSQLDYLPSGRLKAENGTFWYCLPHAKFPSWAIVLNQSGRARIMDRDAEWKC